MDILLFWILLGLLTGVILRFLPHCKSHFWDRSLHEMCFSCTSEFRVQPMWIGLWVLAILLGGLGLVVVLAVLAFHALSRVSL